MTVKLTGNFLATARCLIYQDGNAIAWTFNPNTNQLTAAYTGGGSAGSANPSATIGLTAVNGTAATWMTSDSAPALSQGIVPTWTGLHTFSNGLTVSGGSTTISGHVLTLSAAASVGGTNTGDQVIPAAANPSAATVGLTAANGSAATFLRSDATHALDVTISPTWTGSHTFTPSSGYGWTVNATANGAKLFQATSHTGSISLYGYADSAGSGITNSDPQGSGAMVYLVGETFNIYTAGTQRLSCSATGVFVFTGILAGTPVLTLNTQASTGSGTITIALTDYPGTNVGAKTPKYIPVILDGAKHWIQAIPD